MFTSKLGAVAGAAILVVGCAGHDDKDTATATAALGPSPAALEPGPPQPETFVTLQSLGAGCSVFERSACPGGYWVHEVNHDEASVAIGGFDVSHVDVSVVAQASGGDRDLVLGGKFAMASEPDGAQAFVVLDVWRGLPGVAVDAQDRLFAVETLDAGMVAHPLNREGAHPVDAVSVARVTAKLVDAAWLTARVVSRGALVAGSLEGETLEADQVYLRLPDVVGPCSLRRLHCGEDVATFDRDTNRCLVPTGCDARRSCPQFLPTCDAGYQLVSWPSEPQGCSAFACDPAFLTP